MNIDQDKIVKVKIVTGQELLAVTVEQDEESFICSHVLDMVPAEYDDEDEIRTYYILRPFQSYSDNMENIISINPLTVVAISFPSAKVVEQYVSSLETIQEMLGASEEISATGVEGNVLSFPPNKKLLTED